MPAFLSFLTVGLAEIWVATMVPVWIAWLLAWAGLSTSWVAIAYLLRRPGLLGKHVPWLALVFLWPFLLFARGASFFALRMMRERVEVVPGLWVGGWPRRGAPGLAQLDLTAELPRRGDALRYRNIPMLDGTSPHPSDWREAVDQAVAWRREGLPVLVHCAYGHGRSVMVVVGVLVAEGLAPGWEEAHAKVLAVRPRAIMAPGQRRAMPALVAGVRAPG